MKFSTFSPKLSISPVSTLYKNNSNSASNTIPPLTPFENKQENIYPTEITIITKTTTDIFHLFIFF